MHQMHIQQKRQMKQMKGQHKPMHAQKPKQLPAKSHAPPQQHQPSEKQQPSQKLYGPSQKPSPANLPKLQASHQQQDSYKLAQLYAPDQKQPAAEIPQPSTKPVPQVKVEQVRFGGFKTVPGDCFLGFKLVHQCTVAGAVGWELGALKAIEWFFRLLPRPEARGMK